MNGKVGNTLEGGSHGPYKGNIPAFICRDSKTKKISG